MSEPDQIRRWHVYPTLDEFHDQSAQAIIKAANQSIELRGSFYVVLAGGQTPQPIYGRLKLMETDWSKWHVYFCDERCLPPDHPGRNSHMATHAWAKYVSVPRSQIHSIPAELGAERAAKAYSEELKQLDKFDLVLLGLGEDGHTASLFPGNDYGEDLSLPAAMAVQNAPKPPSHRVTLSAWRLGLARQVFFLVGDKSKLKALIEWRDGRRIPARFINPTTGVDIWAEQAANFSV